MKQEVLPIILAFVIPFTLGMIAGVLLLNWLLERRLKKQTEQYEKEIITFTIVCQFQYKEYVISIMQKYPIVYSENIEEDCFEFKIQGARKQMDALRNEINQFT